MLKMNVRVVKVISKREVTFPRPGAQPPRTPDSARAPAPLCLLKPGERESSENQSPPSNPGHTSDERRSQPLSVGPYVVFYSLAEEEHSSVFLGGLPASEGNDPSPVVIRLFRPSATENVGCLELLRQERSFFQKWGIPLSWS